MKAINGLQETLPSEYVQAFGLNNCESGNFRYMGWCKYRLAWNYLGTLGSTQWNIRSGVGGGRSVTESKKVWTRHDELSTQTNHMDNYKELNGATVTAWEHLRYGFKFVSRAFGGWTFSDTRKVPHDRKDFRGWSCGLSEWDFKHGP